MNGKKGWLLTCCLLMAGMAAAQEAEKEADKMNTDRPDQSEGTQVVKPGQFQGEFGIMYNRIGDDINAVIGRGLLRYGLFKRVEARLLIEDGRHRDPYLEETTQSNYPLAASTKISLIKDHAFLPDFSLVAYVKLPFTSRSGEQSAYWSPSVIAAFQNKLTDWLELDYNAGYKQEAFSTDHVWLATASLQFRLTKKTELFAEYYADYQSGEDPKHNADAGVLYLLKKDLQADLSAGTSLTGDPGNQFVAVGCSFRVPRGHHGHGARQE